MIDTSLTKKMCDFCDSDNIEFQCGKCLNAFYCSTKCGLEDRDTHICETLPSISSNHLCDVCDNKAKIACAYCHGAYYCGQSCYMMDEDDHEMVCAHHDDMSESEIDEEIFLAKNLLAKDKVDIEKTIPVQQLFSIAYGIGKLSTEGEGFFEKKRRKKRRKRRRRRRRRRRRHRRLDRRERRLDRREREIDRNRERERKMHRYPPPSYAYEEE